MVKPQNILRDVSLMHRIIPGNHDNYKEMSYPHFYLTYGPATHGGIDFFYIRGGFSIDYNYRTFGVDLFENEELSYRQLTEMITLFRKVRPTIVLSPESI